MRGSGSAILLDWLLDWLLDRLNRLNRLNRLAYRNRHGSNHRGSRRDSSRGNNREDSFLLLHPGNRPRKGISMLRPGALRQDGIIPHAGVRVVDLAV